MVSRVSSRPNNDVLIKDRICFSPLAKLSSRILNYSSRGLRVKIIFRAEGIQFDPTGEIILNTQRISRNIFSKTSISDITFRAGIGFSEQTELRILEFFKSGEIEGIRGLFDDCTILPPLKQLLEQGQPLINLPVVLDEVPGEYKHYTGFKRFCYAMIIQGLQTRSFEARSPRLCLTRDSLSPARALAELFIDHRKYHNESRGSYVLGFDLLREMPFEIQNGIEYWFREDIKFGEDAVLRFAGLNPIGATY
ncbi:MAG: hypothetical protein FD145_950 [Candidatus Saganbacteria bacterium]|uniref:Uncharacterized protein n=1 Tax=Candidatus Saganbacteria bacterium TaxID=2575572 RepID=A0A833L0S7_UNCSA|nr:MAG: hypothetical protein FD145_950 [Candidatus Saganbacteria bacterium]